MSKNIVAASGLVLASALSFAVSISPASAQCGRASWYALHSKTASGERMNPAAMTAAHRSLPFGTKLQVTNQRNGRSVVVRINDRGPFVRGRMLDVSLAAAKRLGFITSGHTAVCVNKV
jgi:rare lipoprotein A